MAASVHSLERRSARLEGELSRFGLNSVLRKSPEEKPHADEAARIREERNEPAILTERGLSAI